MTVGVRVLLDPDACVGHGRCYALAAEVYEPDEDGHCVVLRDGDVPSDMEAAARKGADNCPEEALSVIQNADVAKQVEE
jgi:ferredoxin